jgi:hypothetical protein
MAVIYSRRLRPVRFGEGEKGRELVIGSRPEAMNALNGFERAVGGEGGGKRRGGMVRCETDFLLERQPGKQFVEGAEGMQLAVVDDADARTEAGGLLHVVRRIDDRQAGPVE